MTANPAIPKARATRAKDGEFPEAQTMDVCASGRGGWICLSHFFIKMWKFFRIYPTLTCSSCKKNPTFAKKKLDRLEAAAPLNRQKSAQPIFFHKHRALVKATLASQAPLNPIAFWRAAAAPLKRKKSAQPIFFHKRRALAKATLASQAPLNRIAPPPPPPIISSYIIEETLIKAHSLTRFFLNKTRKLAAFPALWERRGAPLKCKKHAKHVFIHKARRFSPARAQVPRLWPKGGPFPHVFRPLSILLLITSLSFAHCSSDDNGGGGNGASDPAPAPAPDPVTTPIYVWTTGCTVQGNMMGGTCGNMTEGREGADDLCAARYETDAGSAADRMRISEERGTPAHKALLADSNLLPQNFVIENKENREVQRPDGTSIADVYTNFPSSSMDWNAAVDLASDGKAVWVGWKGTQTDSSNFMDTSSCDDWTSSDSSVEGGRGGSDVSINGVGILGGELGCDGTYSLYCITY